LDKSFLAIKRSKGSQVPWKKMETNFLKFANKIVSNNVLVLAGTDGANALVLPGFSLHEELQLYHSELQMTPLKILQSATINPAKYFDLQNSGQVKEGFIADLVVLDKNPLESIDHIQTINSVIKSGTFISNAAINKQLKIIRRYNIEHQ
jgi:imidazolonepropionase-like amidohydrolase